VTPEPGIGRAARMAFTAWTESSEMVTTPLVPVHPLDGAEEERRFRTISPPNVPPVLALELGQARPRHEGVARVERLVARTGTRSR
jgi:hypothetical protein